MANIEIPSYRRAENEKQIKKEITMPKISADNILTSVLSFLMSRVLIINSFCPFGIAFFASGQKREKQIYSFFGVCLGVLTVHQDLKALKYILSMLIFTAFKLILKKESPYQNFILISVSLFFSGFVMSLFDYMLTYDLLLLVLECIVCGFFSVAMAGAANYLNSGRFFSYITNEKLLSLTFVIALALSGVGRTITIGYFNLCQIVLSVIIMVLALIRGAAVGACAGVTAGIIASLGNENIMSTVGLYALCGFAAGCVKNTGKTGVLTAFLFSGAAVGFLSSFSFSSSGEIVNMILGGALFLALPKKAIERVASFTDGYGIEPDEVQYMKKAKNYITGRLSGLVRSYERLSDAVSVEETDTSFSDTVKKASEHAVMKVCAKCGMKNMCWEREAKESADMINSLSRKAEEKGFFDAFDFPKTFKKRCINFSEFCQSINHYFSLSRANYLWSKQFSGSRSVISEQYREFSKTLSKLKLEFLGELSGDNGYEGKLEAKIYTRLSNLGIDIKNISIRENKRGFYGAEIRFNDSEYKNYKNQIIETVAEVLETKLNIVSSRTRDEDNLLVLEAVYRFYPMCSSATVKKNKREENGDSIIKETLPDSRFFMAVSDGMGTGNEASVQSRKTNEMLRELLYASYPSMQAIKLVNSALSSGGGEVFSTVDMLTVDLMNGESEFIKIGAMPSVLLSEEGAESIFSSNLPIGILDNVSGATIKRTLSADDVVIMFSDGLCDIKKGIRWVADTALEIREKNPDEIAEIILKEAIIRKRGKIDDDMSVVVFKLKENL